MVLTIGQKNKKADFGITGIERRWSEITVAGELFIFFSMFDNYKNNIEEDGFVYEGRGSYVLIPYKNKVDLHRHVFLRKKNVHIILI